MKATLDSGDDLSIDALKAAIDQMIRYPSSGGVVHQLSSALNRKNGYYGFRHDVKFMIWNNPINIPNSYQHRNFMSHIILRGQINLTDEGHTLVHLHARLNPFMMYFLIFILLGLSFIFSPSELALSFQWIPSVLIVVVPMIVIRGIMNVESKSEINHFSEQLQKCINQRSIE
jgi:hypothetical protein